MKPPTQKDGINLQCLNYVLLQVPSAERAIIRAVMP